MLQVSAHLRPTCDKLLRSTAITNKTKILFPGVNFDEDMENILLQTIRIPHKLMYLTDRLPKAKYEGEERDEQCRTSSTISGRLPTIIPKYMGSVQKSKYEESKSRQRVNNEQTAIPPSSKSEVKIRRFSRNINSDIISKQSHIIPSSSVNTHKKLRTNIHSPGLDDAKKSIIDMIYANSRKTRKLKQLYHNSNSNHHEYRDFGDKGKSKEEVGGNKQRNISGTDRYQSHKEYESVIDAYAKAENKLLNAYSPSLRQYYLKQYKNKRSSIINKGKYYNLQKITDIYKQQNSSIK